MTIDEGVHWGSSVVDDVRRVLTDTVADQRTAITATLIRGTGDWDLAEDCVHDAVERALARWPVDGLPDNPAGWLTTTARNRALDVLRRRRTEWAKLQEVVVMVGSTGRPTSTNSPSTAIGCACCSPAAIQRWQWRAGSRSRCGWPAG